MLLEEMIFYHKILIFLLLIGLLVGLAIPNSNIKNVKRRFRVYTFVFHGLISMVGFSGLVAFIFSKDSLNLNILIMILSYIAIVVLEIIKYLKILKLKELQEIKLLNSKFSLISALIVLLNFWEY